MRALTYEGPHTIAVSTMADPVPSDANGAVVRITAAGICGSDLHIYDGHGFSTDLGFCVGHEAVGEVVEVGSGVTAFRPGDRVMVPASTGCGRCEACRANWVAGCTNGGSGCYGLSHGLEGSQAEAVAVPNADTNLVALPDSISDDAGLTLTDNFPTAWYGARRARIQPGDRVTVVGLGPVGQFSVMSALLMGGSQVFAIDLVPERREAAAKLGATPLTEQDPIAELRELTGGQGTEVVLEAVGADATIELSLRAAARTGRVSVVGVNQTRNFPMNLRLAQVKELEFSIGLCSVQRELPALLRLVAAGRVDPSVVVTHHFGLSDGPAAYELFAHSAPDCVGSARWSSTRPDEFLTSCRRSARRRPPLAGPVSRRYGSGWRSVDRQQKRLDRSGSWSDRRRAGQRFPSAAHRPKRSVPSSHSSWPIAMRMSTTTQRSANSI
ncbi:MAG: alcohol dehydrogenase family protein [Ilumatobacteraceae bacterium]